MLSQMKEFSMAILCIVKLLEFIIREQLMQSYPPRALDRRLQEDWAKDAREGTRVLMSLRIDFGPMG